MEDNLLKEVMDEVYQDLFLKTLRKYVTRKSISGWQSVYSFKKYLNLPLWKSVGKFEPFPMAISESRDFCIYIHKREIPLDGNLVEIVRDSIKKSFFENAFFYLDIVGICDDGGKVNKINGKSLAKVERRKCKDDKDEIFVDQVNYDNSSGKIENYSIGEFTLNSVLSFIAGIDDFPLIRRLTYKDFIEGDDYIPEESDFKSYLIICNRRAYDKLSYDKLSEDQRFSSPNQGFPVKFLSNKEFIVDDMVDECFASINPILRDKAICVCISKYAVIEVVVEPEFLFDSDKRVIITRRGESPVWFVSSDGIGSGGVLVGV
jgi:hypothetical protein